PPNEYLTWADPKVDWNIFRADCAATSRRAFAVEEHLRTKPLELRVILRNLCIQITKREQIVRRWQPQNFGVICDVLLRSLRWGRGLRIARRCASGATKEGGARSGSG